MRVWLCPLWFHQVCHWCQLCLSPLSVSVLCSSSEVNLRTVWRRQLLRITTPCRQPDLVASSTVVNGLTFGAVALLYSKGSTQRMGPPESFILGLGNPGSSLPSWLGLSPANLLYREDFSQSTHGVGTTLFQCGVVRLGLTARWCLDLKAKQDVSWWETTITLRTHTQTQSSHTQAHTALAGYALSPSEDRSPLRE